MEKYILYGQIATTIITIAYLPYIFSIFQNKTSPNRTTWLVLFLIGIITFIAYKEIGANATLGVALANVIGPFIIFILSLKFGEGWEDMSDLKYLIFSLIAIILWQIYQSPFIGLIFNLLADSIAFIPTIQKSYFRPKSEDLLTWCLFAIGNIINLFAIEQWSFDIAIYPVYILIAEGIVFLLLFIHFFKSKKTLNTM